MNKKNINLRNARFFGEYIKPAVYLNRKMSKEYLIEIGYKSMSLNDVFNLLGIDKKKILESTDQYGLTKSNIYYKFWYKTDTDRLKLIRNIMDFLESRRLFGVPVLVPDKFCDNFPADYLLGSAMRKEVENIMKTYNIETL